MKWALRGFPALPQFIGLMRDIGQQHGASPAQVALNWRSAKGTVQIAGIKTAALAKDNFAPLEWKLTEAEAAALDEATER
jgi:aryl-alcohol dehydrogenase-like predicted oxidoreductase